RRKRRYQEIEPDEILIDAQNLPDFDTSRLEGRIERPIGSKVFRSFLVLFAILAVVLLVQLGNLQIIKYASLAARAEANSLDQSVIIPPRGMITDRNGVPLAENASVGDEAASTTREYPFGPATANLVGYVSYPKRDQNGNWYQTETKGVVGIEATDNDILAGQNGLKIAETNASGQIVSGSIIQEPHAGQDVRLSIDSGLQRELYNEIQSRSENSHWRGGSGVIMDIETGELLAIVSYPSFNPEVMSSGSPKDAVQKYLTDSRSPFLDRAVSGLYTPGSVVKPFVATAALDEHIISPEKQILSTGSISVPNPF